MRAVTGSVASSRPISLSKAAAVLARFTAGQTTAARPDVSAFVRRASAAFDELVIFHRAARRRPELYATENSKEEAEKWKGRKRSRDDPQIGKKGADGVGVHGEKKKQHRGEGFMEEGIRHRSDGVEPQEDGKGRRKQMKPEVEELPELEDQEDHHKKKRKKRERDL
ncbi:uncharacterized protein LOC141848020 [Curcuma longa]|uniref:uncharacterized protein LOC141848020 n=1 Tax=Curcuma longa TaxID=136217 RepID=UPI003D9E5539